MTEIEFSCEYVTQNVALYVSVQIVHTNNVYYKFQYKCMYNVYDICTYIIHASTI